MKSTLENVYKVVLPAVILVNKISIYNSNFFFFTALGEKVFPITASSQRGTGRHKSLNTQVVTHPSTSDQRSGLTGASKPTTY